MERFSRTWVEINLDNLARNFSQIKAGLKPGVKVMGVVKADAYGHGSIQCAKKLVECGADCLAVSNMLEAVPLRESGIQVPILVLGYTPVSEVSRLAKYNISQTLLNYDYAIDLAKQAENENVTIECHIALDTGMSRIGFDTHNLDLLYTNIATAFYQPSLNITGIFTHFSVADELNENGKAFTIQQHRIFSTVVSELSHRGMDFTYVHCCNSAATVFYPEYHHTMVRPGVILYGLSPTGNESDCTKLYPVMEMKTVVSMIKTVNPGDSISYGCTYTASSPVKVATLPVGYADGYPRSLSGKGMVYINDHLVPVLGKICMDQMMIDVTGVDCKEGDIVTLFGGNSPISLDYIAGMSGTISYEIMCGVSRRVERVYISKGIECEVLDYTLT